MEKLTKRCLNLGSGSKKFTSNDSEEWINLDIEPLKNPDIVADARKLPFKDEEFDEVFAGHFLEHISQRDMKQVLNEIKRVLKTGSKAIFIVPDILKSLYYFKQNMQTWNTLNAVAFGREIHQENAHKVIFTERLLKDLLKDYFKEVILTDSEDYEFNMGWETLAECLK